MVDFGRKYMKIVNFGSFWKKMLDIENVYVYNEFVNGYRSSLSQFESLGAYDAEKC